MNKNVEYKDIPNWPGYRAGTDGTIWCCRKSGSFGYGQTREWRLLKPSVNKSNGRLRVTLSLGKIRYTEQIHTIICSVFIGPRPNGLVICHWDGNHLNNCIDNLRYGTHIDNEADKERHGRRLRGDKHPLAKLCEETVRDIRIYLSKGNTLQSIADQFNVSKKTILGIKQNKIWTWVK